jgi:hypothetical protein
VSEFGAVKKTLAQACLVYEDTLNLYDRIPAQLVPPCAILRPHRPTISFLKMQSSRLAEWCFSIRVITGGVNIEAAQEKAGRLISPSSPLISALRAARFPGGYAKVTEGNVDELRTDSGMYTYAELIVVVLA